MGCCFPLICIASILHGELFLVAVANNFTNDRSFILSVEMIILRLLEQSFGVISTKSSHGKSKV